MGCSWRGPCCCRFSIPHYLAHFLLLLVVMVPLLSLAVSLPAMCTSRLELTAVPGDCAPGGAGGGGRSP